MAEPRIFNPKKIGADNRLRLLTEIEHCADIDPLGQSRKMRQLAVSAEVAETKDLTQQLKLGVACSVLADLTEQGWRINIRDGNIWITPPPDKPRPGETVDKVKDRIRKGLMIASNRQLATPSVQSFIRSMEKERVWNDKIVSVSSVIDDGASLAELLRGFTELPEENCREKLSKIIKPVIQPCSSNAICEFTGIKLLDIWRYCRHTWALEYNPVPGRTLRFLIRNKARKNWPIIGIAMLASPAANYYVRDHWIGWRVDDVIQNIVSGSWSAARVAKRLLDVLRQSIDMIRSDDLVEKSELTEPTEATFFKLQQAAHRAEYDRGADLSERGNNADYLVDIRNVKKEKIDDEGWFRLSNTSLYRKKRAEQLLGLLKCLKFFKDADFYSVPGTALCEVLVTKPGRDAVSSALNEIRKLKLATEVADLSVCGAIPPYNHLLGGKLVALLMSSHEVRKIYRERYEGQVSEIASQMAGKSITRSADLKILTTTSLYGISSAQYNRLHIRAGEQSKLTKGVRWQELEKTQGFTVTHLSKLTVNYMQRLGEAVHGRRRINSVFGEGSSPRTRQVREGLNLIGISDDSVLAQGLSRRVYACEMYPDAKADLHGFVARPKYRVSQKVHAITQAWIDRWVLRRSNRDDVIQGLSKCRPEDISKELHRRVSTAESEKIREPDLLDLADEESAVTG